MDDINIVTDKFEGEDIVVGWAYVNDRCKKLDIKLIMKEVK